MFIYGHVRNNSAVLLWFLWNSWWLWIQVISILLLFLAVIEKRVTSRVLIKWTSPLTRSSVTKTCLPHLGVTWITVKFRDRVHLEEIVIRCVVLQHHCGPSLRWHARSSGGGGGPEIPGVVPPWVRSVAPGVRLLPQHQLVGWTGQHCH